ncbi:MAG: N-succinylarginine dihydrolase [Arenicella sp.]|jgi:succinylarginine dihydrolase|nr:N-succinylarginine dihydrolase [Arenicella sp.]
MSAIKNSYGVEANFDGLVGPSHHYAGLSDGNIASKSNAQSIANPKAAALQGLMKMKALADRGFAQGVLPPHLRPNTSVLRSIGFTGSDAEVIAKAWKQAPEIASRCFSASAMWTANAATVSPAPDTQDGKTHFTPANLTRMFHRSFESRFTARVLKQIFADERYFAHHDPLPAGHYFGDEGAANHTRLAPSHSEKGVEFFVYGEQAFNETRVKPTRYPARQSLEASYAIARLHGLDFDKTVFAQQNPDVIDQGVFHNDVIAVGTTNCLFHHEQAFYQSADVIAELKAKMNSDDFSVVEVPTSQVSVQDAVSTYLFNTQLLDVSQSGKPSFMLVAPTECEDNAAVKAYLKELEQSSSAPIDEVVFFDLRESMKNGGGPACLRLRVQLQQAELNGLGARVLIDDSLYEDLCDWVNTHYRDRLAYEDLTDPQLIDELKAAAIALEQVLGMSGLYELN